MRPSPDDLRAVGATIAAFNAARVPFAFVMSQTPRVKLTEEAAWVLAQHGRVAPVNIAQRVIYAETGASGQMSICMKPSTRQMIEHLAEAEDLPIAEIIERAIGAYRGNR